MATTTKTTTERIPEYFHQWKADDRFPDLKEALEAHRVNLEKCQDLERTINHRIMNTDTHDPAIRILDDLDSDLIYGNAGYTKAVKKFAKKYQGIYGVDEDMSCALSESLKVLREAKLKQLAEIPKLQEELKDAELIKDRDYATYRKLDDKYEAEFDKLLKAQKEEDVKKLQEEVTV
tara:strand:+ start:1198 stop:1728 length:531 start_codon:yes stop_codon:yes gene_type:complete